MSKLLEEYKKPEPIQLTWFEYEYLKVAKKEGFNFIARDEDNRLYGTSEKPEKFNSTWFSSCDYVGMFKSTFSFVKWESKYQEALDRLCENNYFDEKGNCNCDLIVMDRILLQEEKYALLIKEHIQEEINKIDSDIEISIYGNDIDRIYVTYKEFKFEFTYYYSITSRKLCFRGYGKTNTHGYSYDRYTREEQKERERAYGYVRSILKSVLEDS